MRHQRVPEKSSGLSDSGSPLSETVLGWSQAVSLLPTVFLHVFQCHL